MTIIYSLARVTIVVTPVILVILLASPVFDRKYTAIGRYYLWLVVMAVMIFMLVRPPTPVVQIDMPTHILAAGSDVAAETSQTVSGPHVSIDVHTWHIYPVLPHEDL